MNPQWGFFDLDNWLFFLFGAFGAGLPLVFLTVRAAVKSGNLIFERKLDSLRGEIHDIRGEVKREFEGVWEHHKIVRGVALRAEKSVSDLTVRVSRLEGQGEE